MILRFSALSRKIIRRVSTILKLLDLQYGQKWNFTSRIKLTLWFVWRVEGNREKSSVFEGLGVIKSDSLSII